MANNDDVMNCEKCGSTNNVKELRECDLCKKHFCDKCESLFDFICNECECKFGVWEPQLSLEPSPNIADDGTPYWYYSCGVCGKRLDSSMSLHSCAPAEEDLASTLYPITEEDFLIFNK